MDAATSFLTGLIRRTRAGEASRADVATLAVAAGGALVAGVTLYRWATAPGTGRKYMNDDQVRFADPFPVVVSGRTLRIESVAAADVPACAATLAAAAGNEPVMIQCGSEALTPSARESALRWLFSVVLRAALPSSSGSIVLRTPRSEAVAVWYTKGGDITVDALLGQGAWWYVWSYSGWDRRGRFPGYADAIQQRRQRIMKGHEGAFFYLLMSGAQPALADAAVYHTAVIQPVLDMADALGTPCYVEATSEASRDFFTTLGFVQVEAFTLFGFIVYPMKRDARVRSA